MRPFFGGSTTTREHPRPFGELPSRKRTTRYRGCTRLSTQSAILHTLLRECMSTAMSPDAVKKFMHAVPWRPFTICLADGRDIHVPHPDFISISRAGRTVVVTNVDDEFEMIDVFLILSIKTKRPQKSAK